MSRYRQTMREALEQVYKKEDNDHEISMARGELEAIADKATQLAGALQGKSDEGNPLEAWVQSKITKAKDYINSVSDYMMYKPENAKEEVELEEKNTDKYIWSDINTAMMRAGFSPGMIMKVLSGLRGKELSEELEEAKIISDISGVSINKLKQEVMPFSVKVGKVGPGMDSDYEVEFTGSEPNLIKYAKKHLDFDGNNFSQLKKHLAMEETEVNEKTYGWTLVSKAKDLAKKFKDNITKAVAEIEKLEKGLSKNPTVDAELRKYNEQLEEKFTVQITKKDGTTMELGRYNTAAEAQRFVDMYGKGAKVKKEEVELDEIDEKISDIFKANKEGESVKDIAKKLKLSPAMVKKLIGEDLNEQDEQEKDPDKIALAKEKDTDTLERQLKIAQGQINVLKQKIENEKNKAIRPEPNPETGEVPLTIGIAHKVLRDMKDKEAEEKKQKENSDKLQQLNVEEDRLTSFTNKYLSHITESAASDKAKALGLKYMSFGRYGKGGKVTHKSVGGNLQKVGKGDTGTSDKPKSSSKDISKSSSKEKDTSKSFGKGGTSSITLGDLDGSDKDLQDLIKKSGLKMKSKEGEQGDDITLSGDSKDIEKVLDTMYGDDWKDMYQNKGGKYVEKENSLENYKKSNAYEMLAGRAAILDADNITQTDFGLEKDFDRLRSTLKGYGDNETVSLMDKFKDAIEEDDSESYPELKQDLRYALETGDAKNNPVYDQLKKVDDATKIFGQQKYSSGDVKSYLKDTSVMINQLDKLFKMSISEPMTQQDTVRQVRNDSIQRIAQASEKMVDGLRNVAKGIKDVKQIRILANLENEIKDLQPEGGIYQNYALPKRVKDNIFLIKDYMKMYKRYEEGSPNESDERQFRDSLFATIVNNGKSKKITKDYFKEEYLQELSKAEKEKRLQRAKDMIKYYDAQKKAALKGPNKALAKKMLKNETELEEVTQKEIDKFHTDLDNLVHKTFGHSSKEKEKEKMDEKVASSIIRDLQKAYAPMKGKRISPEMANKISKHLDQPSYDLNVLRQLKKADIPFISTIARNKIYKKTGKFEDRRLYVEAVAGLQKKADKSGMPYSILKQVYDRGMAAWKSGHRPGASQQQWAFARVNSFITKSSGTWGGADKDLAKQVKGSK